MRHLRALPCLVALTCGALAQAAAQAPPKDLADYAGIYAAGELASIEIGLEDRYLTAVPPFWGGRPCLLRTGEETFAFSIPQNQPQRTITFQRDSDGRITSLLLTNVDAAHDGMPFKRLDPGEETVATLFLARRAEKAAARALAESDVTPKSLVAFGWNHLKNHPTRVADTALFMQRVSKAHPQDAALASLTAEALLAIGDRSGARKAARHSLTLAPENREAKSFLRRMDLEEPDPGTGYRAVLPFPLTAAYAPPTAPEIAEVRRAWSELDLTPDGIEIVQRSQVAVDQVTYNVSIVLHHIEDRLHFGAVWVPAHATAPLALVINVRGVDLNYTPNDISRGGSLVHWLSAQDIPFVVIYPCLEGNTIVFEGETYRSDGDPSNAWNGATDSTLAFLNAALEITPEADPERIAIFGMSRGGTVALLAAARDERIGLALDISGPTDHFEAMQLHYGWRWEEIMADSMSNGQPIALHADGGQKFDHFFDRVHTDGETLSDVRQRMIASSPIYFVEHLPETHAYYGAEDRPVPLANAQALRARLDALGRLGPQASVRIFDGRGHNGDAYLVVDDVVRRLREWAER